ncbi:MAG: peptidylprolyl isomerase [Pseudomonadota bacterium]
MIVRFLTSLALMWAMIVPAAAQGLFTPVAKVNDRVVTQYELTQRTLFYQALRAPGDPRELAMEKLIEERLQMQAADAMGIEVTDEQLEAGLEEFAARANLSSQEFLAALGRFGIAPETVYDFIRVGVAWRGVVRGRFAPNTQVSESEIDRALASASAQDGGLGSGGVRVLLSEIFLPTNTPEARALAEQRAGEIQQITTVEAFAAAAEQFSAAPSRANGGRQGWVDVANLPEAVRAQIFGLAPGQVTSPIPTPNALALFQLRAIEETGAPTEETVAVEFARFFLPGGRTERNLAEARRIAERVDTCDDLYGVARGLPEDRLLRDTLPIDQISGNIALELAQLDEGEISTNLTTGEGGALVVLMMCGRTFAISEEVDREVVRTQLSNARLASYANGYLEELKADAFIQIQ